MRILWIGEYTTPDLLNRLLNNGYRSMSGRIAQKNITDGLETITTIDSISGCRLPFRGMNRTMYFKGEQWVDRNGGWHNFVDLITVPWAEMLFKQANMEKSAKTWAKKHRDEKCAVLVYSLHTPYLACAELVKKYIPTAKLFCIVPDLPEFMSFKNSAIREYFKKIDTKKIYSRLKKYDGVVLFSENMKQILEVENDRFIVMEGSLHESKLKHNDQPIKENNRNKTILFYSGSLNYGYGIDLLLDAINLVKHQNIELQIVGTGAMVPDIQKKAETDSRIKYFEYIADVDELSNMQRNSDILLCMIPPSNKATEYCFPSKLFEYMITEKPIILFDLKGMVEEYKQYLFIIEKETAESVAEKIDEVIDLPKIEREKTGREAKKFIIENKTNVMQARRIFDFMCKFN